ncbi:peflin-like isoform X1 [Anthonomus grandis grandis]|uniref:peflin-like isoform X1 n=1 Tax=Anthonomus grandis grandis TaxID=2921223 RepID=UPI002165CE75|nr:peflin-like isoform X1 [Anthonomus grandis grandis]
MNMEEFGYTEEKPHVSEKKCCSANVKRSMEDKRKQFVSDIIRDVEGRKIYSPIMENSPVVSPFSRINSVHPAVEKWFRAMETKHEGQISSKELQQAFEIFQGKHFSDAACKFVVRLFDLDKNGGLDIKEFESLYYYIRQWLTAFNTYDRDQSGFLDETELDYALKQLDINFTQDFIKFLITRNNPKAKKMSLDQYIITCIQIQRFTDEFKNRDINYSGSINIKYEDFLEMIMRCF